MRVPLIEDDRMIDTAIRHALNDVTHAMDWVLQRETPIHSAESEAASSPRRFSAVPGPTATRCFGHLRAPGRRLPAVVTEGDWIDRIDFGQPPSGIGMNSISRVARGER